MAYIEVSSAKFEYSLFANILVEGVNFEREPDRLHIITRSKLLQAAEHYGGPLAVALDAWYRVANSAKWKHLQDVRSTYSSADGVPVGKKVYTVFNILGNSFRLVVGINYESQTVFIKHILTHAEYDKGDWKK